MKYIKTYENITPPKYEEGDIIKVRVEAWGKSNPIKPSKMHEFMVILIIKNVIINNDFMVYVCYPFDTKDKEDNVYVHENDIIESITHEDVEIIINSDKYNL